MDNAHTKSEEAILNGYHLSTVAECSDFKKKVVFQDNCVLSYLRREETVNELIVILFRDNGKEGSSQSLIEKIMHLIKFTKTMADILSNSDAFVGFVDSFFDEFKNEGRFNILCSVIKEIIMKFCEANQTNFFSRIPFFMGSMHKYIYLNAIKELFVDMVINYSSIYTLTPEIIECIYNDCLRRNNIYEYLVIANRIVESASSSRRYNRSILLCFNATSFVDIICSEEMTINKVNAISILKNLNLEEDIKTKISERLLQNIENMSSIVKAKVINFTNKIPENYVHIIKDPYVHCNIKREIVAQIEHVNSFNEKDIIILYSNLNNQENKTNPFIADCLSIILNKPQFINNSKWSSIRSVVHEKKEKREISYGVNNQKTGHISNDFSFLCMPRNEAKRNKRTKATEIPGLYRFSANMWICGF